MKRWIRKAVIGIVGIIVSVSLTGALYQWVGTTIDQRRYAPPGRLVEVEGHRMHLYCTGEGSPTVVMDAFGQGWSLHWSRVQPQVAKFTRACSYDRAGYGWSDSGPTPRTAQQVASELHTLLSKAEIAGPYVLVGHSFSGFTARIFRHQYPKEVAGIVLVDAGHEDVWQYPERRKAHDAFARMLSVARVAAATGSVRLLTALGKSPFLPEDQLHEVPRELQPMLLAGLARTSFVTTVAQEDAALPETQNQARASGSLNDLPLIVITANNQSWKVPAGVDPTMFNEQWLELQRKLVALSSRGTQIFADKSSHHIPLDQPEVVVEGIQRVLDAMRSESR